MDQHPEHQRALRAFRADLHIHTALSPCASEEMTPPAIVSAAMGAGLDMIAVSDHNSAGNIAAVQQAAAAAGGALTVIPGMEITSVEEVHVLGLFPDAPAAERVAATLRSLLPTADEQYYAFFGEQPLLAEDGRQLGSETAALATAAPLDLNDTVQLIHQAGGLAIAAHVDRHAFSVFSQLGFFPEDAGFDGVEVSRRLAEGSPLLDQFAALGLPVTRSSDSHFLEEIGTGHTDLRLAVPEFSEVALALAGAQGRSVARA
jgi:3',5'-nucleoside bisphosphate phosphatase